MRRVCGFDTLSAHLVRKSLSFALSLTLGVLPMAPAFAREDERTSYLANNRYQDYQTQYKPEKTPPPPPNWTGRYGCRTPP